MLRPLKSLIPAVLSLLAFSVVLGTPARADLIKQGTAYTRSVLVLNQDGTNALGLTTGVFTVSASKNGSPMAVIATPTITELGLGRYALAYTAALTSTVGALDLALTTSLTLQADVHDQVIPADFSDLLALNTTIPSGILLNPGNKIGADSAGRVLLQPLQTGVTIPIVGTLTDKSNFTLAPSEYLAVANSVLSAPTDGLTVRQQITLMTSVLSRNFAVSYNALTRIQTTVYYKADGSTPLATTTTVFDTTGRQSTRQTAFSNLP